ncbi:tetratricopeptide repeat protein [bacterium]|nr:tetratricopeptide repeat protein [bacterium]
MMKGKINAKQFEKLLSNLWWIIPLLAILVYIQSFKAGFTNWDDPWLTINNSTIKGFTWENIRSIFAVKSSGTYQPLRTFSYLIDYSIGGENPFVYHLHNVLLYALNCLLVLLILKQFMKNAAALIGAAIFAVLPIHVEAVAWIAARKEVLSGLFLFLSFFLYMKFRKNSKISLYIFSVLCFILSIISKPSAVVLPFILPVYELISRKPFKTWWKFILPYMIPNILIIFYFIFFAGTSRTSYHSGNLFYILLTEAWVTIRYIWNLVFPSNLCPRYMVYSFRKVNFLGIFSIILNAFIILIGIIKAKRYPRISFAIFWFYVGLIPVSNIIPISTLMADRYIYISSFAYALLLGVLAENLLKKAKWGVLVFLLLVTVYGIQTCSVSSNWRNSYTLWTSTLEKNPDHQLAHNQLGMYYIDRGDTLSAFQHFQKATEIMPEYHQAQFNLCGAAYSLGKFELAIKAGEKAVSLEPDNPEYHYQLGTSYFGINDDENALYHLNKAIELKPDYRDALMNKGTIYYHEQDYQKALEIFYDVESKWEPTPILINNIAAANYMLGNSGKALEYYKRYLELFPEAPDVEIIRRNVEIINGRLKNQN